MRRWPVAHRGRAGDAVIGEVGRCCCDSESNEDGRDEGDRRD